MNDTLKGKRLLLLGGSGWTDAIKAFASAHDIVLVATGNDSSADIFKIADECYNVDSTHHEAMKRLIRDKHIDGVYMGGSEKVIAHACHYINELGLPCYCTPGQWETLQNKEKFKALCQQFGLPCAKEYYLDSGDINYPVITKPIDGHSGIGVSICNNMRELEAGYATACHASPSGTAIIEQMVCNDSIYAYYTFSNGKAILSAMDSKYSVKYTHPDAYVACLHLFESSQKDEFRRRYEDKLLAMFRYLGIREGSIWIEVFYHQGHYYFNEPGFRYAGYVSIYPVEYFSGINQLASDITFALTGKSRIDDNMSLFTSAVPRKRFYCMYYMQLQYGKIAMIDGVEKLRSMPECARLTISKDIGDSIDGPRTLSQILGSVHLVFDTVEELREIVDRVHRTLHVTDTDGREMFVSMIDWKKVVI